MSEVLSEFLPWHGHSLWGHLAHGKLAKSLSTWARLKEGRTDLFSGAWAWVFIKNWPVCAKTGNLQLSLSVFTAQAANLQRLADSTHCAAPLCVPRFQAIVAVMSENPIWSRLHRLCVCPFLIRSLHPTRVPGSKLWGTWSSIIKCFCSLHEFRFDSHSTW